MLHGVSQSGHTKRHGLSSIIGQSPGPGNARGGWGGGGGGASGEKDTRPPPCVMRDAVAPAGRDETQGGHSTPDVRHCRHPRCSTEGPGVLPDAAGRAAAVYAEGLAGMPRQIMWEILEGASTPKMGFGREGGGGGGGGAEKKRSATSNPTPQSHFRSSSNPTPPPIPPPPMAPPIPPAPVLDLTTSLRGDLARSFKGWGVQGGGGGAGTPPTYTPAPRWCRAVHRSLGGGGGGSSNGTSNSTSKPTSAD